MIQALHTDVQKLRDDEKAKFLQSFFKTEKGGYAEGDLFYGLTVPQSRVIARKYRDLDQNSIQKLLYSKIHEERLMALLILVDQFAKGGEEQKKSIYEFYITHARQVNNWDLVDCSADKIVGAYLYGKDTKILKKLAKSENLWKRRISIVATYYFIKKGKYEKTFEISEMLLADKHDLIHKAVGWMLREVEKNCGQEILEQFLKKHIHELPRTTLRYAIEHFPEGLRKRYLKSEV